MTKKVDPRLRHRRNVARLVGLGTPVASHPGAGAALLGNILLELGLDYVDPYTEVLAADGSARPAADRVDYRRRMAASARRDAEVSTLGKVRLVKTHLLPEDFPQPRGAILLVRDPRDSLYSYYHWRLGFSEEGEDRDFRGFLDSLHPLGLRPVDDWTRFHRRWTALLEGPLNPTTIVRFEDLKTEPVAEVMRMLEALGLAAPLDWVTAAVEASTFEIMRHHEDQHAAAGPRIMRRGRPGEWTEWYYGEIADYFQHPGFRSVAGLLGYRL